MAHKEEVIVNAIWGPIKNTMARRKTIIIIGLYLIWFEIQKSEVS